MIRSCSVQDDGNVESAMRQSQGMGRSVGVTGECDMTVRFHKQIGWEALNRAQYGIHDEGRMEE